LEDMKAEVSPQRLSVNRRISLSRAWSFLNLEVRVRRGRKLLISLYSVIRIEVRLSINAERESNQSREQKKSSNIFVAGPGTSMRGVN